MKMTLDTEALFNGYSIIANISNSIINNVSKKISVPPISNNKYSTININNTIFSNLR